MATHYIYKDTPCDNGECPYNANSGMDCRNYCGLAVDENEYPNENEEDEETIWI